MSDLSDTVSLLSEGPEARTVSSGTETEWEYAPREVFEVRPSAHTTAAFTSLDLISARDVFGQRACIMKVPRRLSEVHSDARCAWHCKRSTQEWNLMIPRRSQEVGNCSSSSHESSCTSLREGARSQRRSCLSSPSLQKGGG